MGKDNRRPDRAPARRSGALMVGAVLAVALSGPVFAAAPTPDVDPHLASVKGLSNLCRSTQPGPRAACVGYVVGAADILTTFGNSGSKDGLCLVNYSSADLPRLFVDWAEKHPSFATAPGMAGVILSLREKWPCR